MGNETAKRWPKPAKINNLAIVGPNRHQLCYIWLTLDASITQGSKLDLNFVHSPTCPCTIQPNEGQNEGKWINLAVTHPKPSLIVLRLIHFRNLYYPRVKTQPQLRHQPHLPLHCGAPNDGQPNIEHSAKRWPKSAKIDKSCNHLSKQSLIVLRLAHYNNVYYLKVEHQHHLVLHCGARFSQTMTKIS